MNVLHHSDDYERQVHLYLTTSRPHPPPPYRAISLPVAPSHLGSPGRSFALLSTCRPSLYLVMTSHHTHMLFHSCQSTQQARRWEQMEAFREEDSRVNQVPTTCIIAHT